MRIDIADVECAGIFDVDCIVKRLVEAKVLGWIDVLDVDCVDERLIEVEYDECQGILDVHCVIDRLADVEDLDRIQVGGVEYMLGLDVQC